MKLYVFTIAALLSTTVPACAAPLRDVRPGHWASASVTRMVSKKIMQPGPDGKFQGDKPVTRYELAVTLDRFVRYIEAGKKPLHPTTVKPNLVLPKKASAEVKGALIHLTTCGFLSPDSPLITKDSRGLVTAQELAEAIAQVTIRLSDRSLPPQKS